MTAWLELLEDESEAEERKRWEAFTSALSGLFCAGIASEGVLTGTTSPTWAVPFPLAEHEDGKYSPPRPPDEPLLAERTART